MPEIDHLERCFSSQVQTIFYKEMGEFMNIHEVAD